MALISAMKGKYDPVAMAFMDPICDDMPIVQAFAAHRLAAERGSWLGCGNLAIIHRPQTASDVTQQTPSRGVNMRGRGDG